MSQNRNNLRFGMIAVQKGFATPEQVVDALALQAKENFSTGRHTRIGEILLSQGVINRHQLDEVIQSC